MVSAWGLTETAPMVTTVHFPIERAGVIGLPGPESELKMIPAALPIRMTRPRTSW
jgi:feruloyl-CoA synthase